jgi:hypothetical protein
MDDIDQSFAVDQYAQFVNQLQEKLDALVENKVG